MSIIEIPIYESFPKYHSVCDIKLKDIIKCQETWQSCPTSSVKDVHSFLINEYKGNTYLYTFIDSLTHINENNVHKWKEFIFGKIQEEKERLTTYVSAKNVEFDRQNILSFLETCGLVFSKQHKGKLTTLLDIIIEECKEDCLPYLCLSITSTQEIVASCILYRYSFKQLIECSYLCGNADILFSYMLHQPEYAQSTIYYTMLYEDKQSNHDILESFSTIMSYGFQLRREKPYNLQFIRTPQLLSVIDKESIQSILQHSFKLEQGAFNVLYDSFVVYSSTQHLKSFFSSLFYFLFKGKMDDSLLNKQLRMVCFLHKFKSSHSICTYFDLFLFLLHHPNYCSIFFYNLTRIFLVPSCISDIYHIDSILKKKIKECMECNIACIGDIKPIVQYCIKSALFNSNCSQVHTNILGYPSISLQPLKHLEYINVDSVLHSYLTEQTIPECNSNISFFTHQLETIYQSSSIHFLQLRTLEQELMAIHIKDAVNEPSPVVYVYSSHCIPSVYDIKECIELLTYSYTKIMCVVLVTPVFYFVVQLSSLFMMDSIEQYSELVDKYNISLEGKNKCQQSIQKSFTLEWNQISPFVIHSFIRDDANKMLKITVPLVQCISSGEKEEEVEEQSSVFSDIGPFYQLDDPIMHKYNEEVYIYDEENIEDINEQIAETEYSNALLFEEFNRYGIPEEEYDPDRKQDTNKKEYYESLAEKESYQLFIDKQYEEEGVEVVEKMEDTSDTDNKNLLRQSSEEKGQSLTSTIKELIPQDEELGSSEDYLLHLNTVKEDMTEDDHSNDSIYIHQMDLHLS